MDLKTYAVLRKLTANSELLQYVAANQPVPINILESDMQELIADLRSDNAESLVSDYEKYLRENVRFGLTQASDDTYEVSGDINDAVVDSIELVHGVDKRTMVSNLITGFMGDMRSDRVVEIEDLSLIEKVSDFVAMTEKPVFGRPAQTVPVQPVQPAQTVPVQPAQPVQPVQPAQPVQLAQPVQPVQPVQPELDGLDLDLDAVLAGNAPATSPEVMGEAEPVSIPDEYDINNYGDASFMDGKLPPTELPIEAPLFDIPDAGIASIDELLDNDDDELADETTENPFKVAYDYLVDQIKEYNLDDRLPGLHV